jgi:hypothetical protein
MDETNYSPPVRIFIPAALFLGLIGWGGLIFLVFYALPTLGPRWLFFFTGVMAFTGTMLPIVAYLHLRFPSTPPVTSGIIFREAILAGIYLPTLAWMQIGRVLTVGLAALLAIGLLILELLLRVRERSKWKP